MVLLQSHRSKLLYLVNATHQFVTCLALIAGLFCLDVFSNCLHFDLFALNYLSNQTLEAMCTEEKVSFIF
jgi:hypothetical protein